MKEFLGKTTLVVTLTLLSISSYGQLTVDKHKITIRADTMEVREAFKLLHYMIPKGQKIDKVVLKDGHRYVQSRWFVNRMLKRYAYVDGKKYLTRL